MKYLVLLLLVFVPAEAARKDETLKCIRWGWIGDVFEQKVYCIEWAKKDCSNRLHKEICKRE